MPKMIFIFNINSTVGAIWKIIDYWMCQQANSQEFFEGRGGFYKFKFKVMFTFSVFDWKCPLIKGICHQKWMILKWWCSFFHFSEIPFFFEKLSKNQYCQLSWILVPRLIWICRIESWCSLFLFSKKNVLFAQTWSQSSKLSV